MAFRHHSLGAKVATDPASAYADLVELFREHRSRDAVAAALEVDCKTLTRWIAKLTKSGLADPRDTVDVPRRGRPRAA